MGNVVVLGSLNFDTVAVIDEFPEPGNTILAKSLAFLTGGKAAIRPSPQRNKART